jgi:hypothetical protein
LGKSLERIALAFRELTDNYEARKGAKSPYSRGKPLSFFSVSNMRIGNRGLMRFVDAVRDELALIHDKLDILALGLDYKRYAKFDQLTPVVIKVMTETSEYQVLDYQRKRPLSRDDCQFCFDSALRIQELDT